MNIFVHMLTAVYKLCGIINMILTPTFVDISYKHRIHIFIISNSFSKYTVFSLQHQ